MFCLQMVDLHEIPFLYNINFVSMLKTTAWISQYPVLCDIHHSLNNIQHKDIRKYSDRGYLPHLMLVAAFYCPVHILVQNIMNRCTTHRISTMCSIIFNNIHNEH